MIYWIFYGLWGCVLSLMKLLRLYLRLILVKFYFWRLIFLKLIFVILVVCFWYMIWVSVRFFLWKLWSLVILFMLVLILLVVCLWILLILLLWRLESNCLLRILLLLFCLEYCFLRWFDYYSLWVMWSIIMLWIELWNFFIVIRIK